MTESEQFQIITFFEFKPLCDLALIRQSLKDVMFETGVRGTIVIAEEGFNSTVCGKPQQIATFVPAVEEIFQTRLRYRSSLHDTAPLRKIDVKIRPEIVTLRKNVEISLGEGTHVSPHDWNSLIQDEETFVLDARNDYEYMSGTFRGAVNPGTRKFSDLPRFVAEHLDPAVHKRVAMFCTGGIRCEKFAPFMKQLGFENVYQLEGGILGYLDETPQDESLWEGECFVFDERKTVDHNLKKGDLPDYSLRGHDKRR